MLQNRYGDQEFPVRDRWSHVRAYRLAAVRRDPTRAALRNLLWVAPAVVLLIAVIGIAHPFTGVPDDATNDRVFLVALGAFVVLVAIGLFLSSLVDRTVPRREQQRYLALTGQRDVSERQQQLLALDAQSDYAIGGWNSSLGYGPAWSRMPAGLRQAQEGKAKRSFFVTMPLFDTAPLRARLDEQDHIASGPDVELFVADALDDTSLSARFHRVLHGADGERMLARVASLTGTSQWDLRALDQPEAGAPARLLWGADTQRVIAVARMAYLADHIDDDTAWRLLERAAEPAAALFTSWDEYWANVRVGLAFWTDRLEVVQNFDSALAGLRASSWPATRVPFPRGPLPAWLPTFTVPEARPADER